MIKFAAKFLFINQPANTITEITCFHCGDECDGRIHEGDLAFCCSGCRQVYLLLNENQLCNYYDLANHPGIKAKGKFISGRFGYLDDDAVIDKIARFRSDKQVNLQFSLPQVHCSSCVFLLENLHRLDEGILSSSVTFQRKEIFISYDPRVTSLRKVVELLAFTGYEPALSLYDGVTGEKKQSGLDQIKTFRKKQLSRIGVAGFCFANVMMLSFPEYLSSGEMEPSLKQLFPWLNFVLSLPVLFYCAPVFFKSAWKGLRNKEINIDAPISLATLVAFGRSYYEIVSGTGAGYLDSACGIIFFMLAGRWFQEKTYDALSFDRDYRSFLPLSVTVVEQRMVEGNTLRHERSVAIVQLKKGDTILVHNGEIIPCDATLIHGDAHIDYSFVNGETAAVHKTPGELLYAGGRQTAGNILLKVEEAASQSYITELWNNEIFNGEKKAPVSYIHPWGRYFTLILFSIATIGSIYWANVDPRNILPVLVSVLIVACPCSLLLSATFTYGNMLRIFGRNNLYLRNAHVIEKMAAADTIVFDKTGTLTESQHSKVSYSGEPLSSAEQNLIFAMSRQTAHPLGKLLSAQLPPPGSADMLLDELTEYQGIGIEAQSNGMLARVGTSSFIKNTSNANNNAGTSLHVEINGKLKGQFNISNDYREGMSEAVSALAEKGYDLHVLSGDNETEKTNLRRIFGNEAEIRFHQLPLDKLTYVKQLQQKKKNVLMVGDGLNDAGALVQANVGIAVNNENSQFTPACDAILDAKKTALLPKFLQFARNGKMIVTASFILSIAYNVVGISFAVSASLSPLVAAILMPASSISIVLFVTLAGNLVAKRQGLK